MSESVLIGHLLLLLLSANGVPIVVRKLLNGIGGWPVDGGYVAADGNRLLGETKTWRGIVISIVVTAGVAAFLGYSLLIGGLFALYSLIGDLFSSFIKRRAAMPPSSRATGLDQIPEAALPLILLHEQLAIDAVTGALVLVGFVLMEVVLSKLLFKLQIRRRPY